MKKRQKLNFTERELIERFLKKQGVSPTRLVLVPRGPTAGDKSDRVEFVVEEEEPLGTPVGKATEPATVPTPGIDLEMQF